MTRKALSDLRVAHREVSFADLREPGMAPEDLAALLSARGDAAINRSSTTWRDLPEAEKARPVADLAALYPTLLKRPVIRAGGQWHQGWTPAVRAALGL